jgi:hypothetical protein
MTPDQIKAVLRDYLDIVVKRLSLYASPQDAPKQLHEDSYSAQRVDWPDKARHIAWMCQKAQELVDEGELDKAERWLGFIQGWLWSHDYRTINEMRDDRSP